MWIRDKSKEDMKQFLKRERLYIWLILFILLLNLLMFITESKKGALPKEAAEPSKTERLFDKKTGLEGAVRKDPGLNAIMAVIILGMMFFIFIGLFIDIIIILARAGKKELIARSHSPPVARWGVWDAAKVMILFFFFGYILAIIEGSLIPVFPSIKEYGRAVSIANTTVMDIIGIILVFYFALSFYGHRAADLGLTAKNFLKNAAYGVAGYISVVPALVASLFVTALVMDIFGLAPKPQPILELFMKEDKWGMLTYLTVFVAIIGPVMEEIYFRGFLYSAVKKRLGMGRAIFISGLLFSFIHAHMVGFLPILILGAFLAYLYEKTGSLVPSITVHIIHNMIMILFIFIIKSTTL